MSAKYVVTVEVPVRNGMTYERSFHDADDAYEQAQTWIAMGFGVVMRADGIAVTVPFP